MFVIQSEGCITHDGEQGGGAGARQAGLGPREAGEHGGRAGPDRRGWGPGQAGLGNTGGGAGAPDRRGWGPGQAGLGREAGEHGRADAERGIRRRPDHAHALTCLVALAAQLARSILQTQLRPVSPGAEILSGCSATISKPSLRGTRPLATFALS